LAHDQETVNIVNVVKQEDVNAVTAVNVVKQEDVNAVTAVNVVKQEDVNAVKRSRFHHSRYSRHSRLVRI
jgi:hypothetical protein